MDVYQLPPLYPPKISKPLELDNSEKYQSILSYKKSLRNDLKNSFYFIETNDMIIERYSDRYSKLKKADVNKWQPGYIIKKDKIYFTKSEKCSSLDWNRLPKELKYFYEKDEKKVHKRKVVAPNLVKRKLAKNKLDLGLLEKINGEEDLENEENEEMEDDIKKEKKSEKGSDEEEENQDLENADEEDIEEENDYIDAYFDNGENYGDDDGGGGDEDGPIY